MSTASYLNELNTPILPDEDAPSFSEARLNTLPIARPEMMTGYVAGKKPWRDAEGRLWGLGKDAKDQWVRFRHYQHNSVQDCEMREGHLLKPAKWPIPDETMHVGGGLTVPRAGSLAVECELCGAWVIVTNAMAESPPDGVRIVLPEAKKK